MKKVTVFVICFLLMGYGAHANADFSAARSRFINLFTGGGAISGEALQAVSRINTQGLSRKASMERTDYLWSDLTAVSDVNVNEAYTRIRAMALAYKAGSSLKGDTQLRDDILYALDKMYETRYNENTVMSGNWWYWEIGNGKALTETLLLMRDCLTDTQIELYLRGVTRFNPTINYFNPYWGVTTGTNRVHKCAIMAFSGILTDDALTVQTALNGLNDVFTYVTSGDGFYQDGSFIQHNGFAYTGGYGAELMEYIAVLGYIFDGGDYEFNAARKNFLENVIFNAYEPYLYGGAAMDGVRGRVISRRGQSDKISGYLILDGVIVLSQILPNADRINSMIKLMLDGDSGFYNTFSLFSTVRAASIQNDTAITKRADYNLHKQSWGMDRVVHHRANFSAELSLFSDRTMNYESINGENLKGFYTADGMLYIYTKNKKHYTDNYWQTADMYSLPGTTITRTNLTGGYKQGEYGVSSWVGGAALDDLYGCVGFDYESVITATKAKKSWFFFDNEVVCLGAGITAGSETTIESRKIKANNVFTVDGAAKSSSQALSGPVWAHLKEDGGNGIGYYFPSPQYVTMKREDRSGKWSDINSGGSNDTTTSKYLTLYINHDVQNNYAYVILPEMSAENTALYALNPDIEIIENSENIQAAEYKNGVFAVNFWKDETKSAGGFVTSDKKASIILKEENGILNIGVSDPTQKYSGLITVEIHSEALGVIEKDRRINVISQAPTIIFTVNTDNSRGETLNLKLQTEEKAAKVIFKDNEGKRLKALDNSGSVTCQITPEADFSEASAAYIAVYKADNQLKYVQKSDFSDMRKKNISVNYENGDYIAAYIWDGLKPLQAAEIIR